HGACGLYRHLTIAKEFFAPGPKDWVESDSGSESAGSSHSGGNPRDRKTRHHFATSIAWGKEALCTYRLWSGRAWGLSAGNSLRHYHATDVSGSSRPPRQPSRCRAKNGEAGQKRGGVQL